MNTNVIINNVCKELKNQAMGILRQLYVTVHAKTFHKLAKIFFEIRANFTLPIFNLLSLQILHG